MPFSKSWKCTSRFGDCNFSFLRNSQVQINFKLNEENRMITYWQRASRAKTRDWRGGILVPRGRAPFGQHQESRPLAMSNTGSPRFTDFPPLCACSRWRLTNLIGSGLNLLCLQSHTKPECRWTRPEVHSGQTTGHSREHARDLSTSGQFPSSSYKIPRSTSPHSSHLGTKFNHSAPTNVLFPSFTA